MPAQTIDAPQISVALHLDPTTILYRGRSGFTLTRHNDDVGTIGPEFFDVNGAAVDLLRLIDGTATIDDITTTYCREHALDLDNNADWIAEFVEQMRVRGVVALGEPDPHAPLVEVGDDALVRPVHLTVEVTDVCNLACGHCYLSASPQNHRAIDYATFSRLVEEFQAQHGLSIELTGGEFFVHREWRDILSLALQRFSLVGLLTNGTFLPDDAVDMLAAHRDQVTVGVSLDSVHPEAHDRLRGKRKAFERTVANIKRLTEAGVRVRIGSVIFDDNMWELHELAQLAVDLGAWMFSFNYVETFGKGIDFAEGHSVTFTPEYRTYVTGVLKDFATVIPIIVGEGHGTNRNCGAGSGSVVMDPEGWLRPCAIFPATHGFGNLLTQSADEVYSSRFTELFTAAPCPNEAHGCPTECPSFAHCFGCTLKGLEKNASDLSRAYCTWAESNGLEELLDLYVTTITRG